MRTKPVSLDSSYNTPRSMPLDQASRSNRKPAFTTISSVNIDGEPCKRLLLVLRTNGCTHAKRGRGCCICGYQYHTIDGMTEVSGHDLLFQYAEALNKFSYCLKDIKEIDLLSPGSFLCNKEVDPTFQNQVMTEIAKLRDVKRVVIESRPEFVNQGVLRELSSHLREDQLLEIALGIESSNDHIRNDIIGKGFSWSDIEETLKHCAASGTAVQFYLVIKPPTLNEYESIVDGMRSASAVANAAHKYNVPFRIAFQPIFVPVGSDLERQFDLGQYSLVNLWSVIEIIKNTHYLGTMSVALEDENLSKGRRPSTCNICSAKVMIAIDDFNASQNVNVFKRLSCPCKNRWRESLMQLMRQAEQKRGGSLYSARNVIY